MVRASIDTVSTGGKRNHSLVQLPRWTTNLLDWTVVVPRKIVERTAPSAKLRGSSVLTCNERGFRALFRNRLSAWI